VRHLHLYPRRAGNLSVYDRRTENFAAACISSTLMAHPTLLAVSHGTSDAAGARAIEALVARVAERLDGIDVRAAFVDVQQPDLTDVVPALAGPVVIVPLLLSNGFHVRHDLHGIAKTRPDVVVAEPLGPDPRLAEVLAQRLAEVPALCLAGTPAQDPAEVPAPRPPASTDPTVILAVAGSRDPRSVTDAEGMAALLRTHTGRPVELAYLAARSPRLSEVVAQHPHAPVAIYLLAQGFFFDLERTQAAGHQVSMPLLDGSLTPQPLIDLIADRYFEGVSKLNEVMCASV